MILSQGSIVMCQKQSRFQFEPRPCGLREGRAAASVGDDLCSFPCTEEPFRRCDDAIMPRGPAETLARLAGRAVCVLVEPHADVIALYRLRAPYLAFVTCGVHATAHDVETARPMFIDNMK